MIHTHSSVKDGTITHEGETYPIVKGLVDCPPHVGDFLRLTPCEPAWVGVPVVADDEPAAVVKVETSDPTLVLQNTVPDVQAFVAGETSAEVLDALEMAERAGKQRKGVLDAILQRLDVLSAPGT